MFSVFKSNFVVKTTIVFDNEVMDSCAWHCMSEQSWMNSDENLIRAQTAVQSWSDIAFSGFSIGFLYSAQSKWRNANGATQMAQCKWRNAMQWRNETLQNACKTNGLYLLTTLYSQQSQNERVNDVIPHRKFPEKFRRPIFPEKLQPHFWLSSLLYVLIFYAQHDGVRTPIRF